MNHENASATREHKPHVLGLKIYAGVWISLLILTVITVRVSYLDFGILNLVVAMGVATLKAALVVLFFMHLKYDEPFNVLVFVASLGFLAVFFMLTLADTVERGQVDPLEKGTIVPVPARAAGTDYGNPAKGEDPGEVETRGGHPASGEAAPEEPEKEDAPAAGEGH